MHSAQQKKQHRSPFTKWLKFKKKKKKPFTYSRWVTRGKTKLLKPEFGPYTFINSYIQGALGENQYHCFFPRVPKISRKNDCYRFILGQTWSNKINEIKIRALCIFKLIYTECSPKEAVSLLFLGSS